MSILRHSLRSSLFFATCVWKWCRLMLRKLHCRSLERYAKMYCSAVMPEMVNLNFDSTSYHTRSYLKNIIILYIIYYYIFLLYSYIL